MKFTTRMGTAIATTALVANLLAPAAFADTGVEISGNGAGSNNSVNLSNNNTTNITQKNNFTVELNISSNASTGGNKANKNTGGDVTVTSGDATSNVGVTVTGGSNSLDVAGCGCEGTDSGVLVSGNGAGSKNKVTQKNTKKTTVNQTNNTTVKVKSLKSNAKTGKNSANKNTGGSTEVTSGGAESNVGVEVTAPDNTLNVTP